MVKITSEQYPEKTFVLVERSAIFLTKMLSPTGRPATNKPNFYSPFPRRYPLLTVALTSKVQGLNEDLRQSSNSAATGFRLRFDSCVLEYDVDSAPKVCAKI